MTTFHSHYADDLNIPTSWVDESYNNDVCPSWVYKEYRIFINHRLSSERTDQTEDALRFWICLNSDYIDLNEMWLYVSTDSFDEVLSITKTED
jgi:hypothetical protein